MHLVKSVSEPRFTQIASGNKRVEGRLCKGGVAKLKAKDTVKWVNTEMGFKRSVITQVVSVQEYRTFRTYLMAEKLANTLPSRGIDTAEKGVKVYRQFFDKDAEKEHGVVAIKLKVLGV